MSLKMVVGEDFPRAHWMLDDQPPFADHSGYERAANGPVVTNLLPSGNVENSATFSPNDSNWTRTIDTTVFHSGTRSVRFNHNQSKSISNLIASVYGAGHMPQLTILPSTNYGLGGWVRSNIGALVRLRTTWQNAAGSSNLLDRFSDYFTLTPNAWTYVYFENVSHSQSSKVWLGFEARTPSGDAAATDFVWADDFVFVENPPAGMTSFDGSTPGASWTGAVNNSPSTIPLFTLVPQYGTSLAKGASRSLIVNNTRKLTVATPVFKKGFEYRPFSVEAFVRPVITGATGEQQIWGNDGSMDGLVINGNVVSFVTKYEDGSEARCSYNLMDPQSFAAVGVHTINKNMLYINGEHVAEVEITPAQQASKFVATGAVQSCGSSTTSNSLMMNSLSVYDLELEEEAAMTHYANAQDTLGAEDVAIDYKGALLEFGVEGALAPFFQIEYSSESEWALGHRVNCAINDGTLYPAVSQGVSVAGYWETVVPLGLSSSAIYAANLLWEGTGAVVSTSRDGIEWTVAQKGKALTTVPRGTNGTNEYLYIRVAFPGGYANDKSFFDNMVFSLYMTGTITNFSGREVILDKATPEDDTDVIDYHQNWGAEMEAGTLTIKAATGDMGIKARTIEVWGQKGLTGTFTNNLGAAARVRTNGGAQQSWRTGEWQLFHYVFDSDFTGDIVFSGTGQIGHVVLYPETLSDAVIKEIYDSYTGKPKIQVEVDEVFDIHEFNGAVDIYEYDWSIESSG